MYGSGIETQMLESNMLNIEVTRNVAGQVVKADVMAEWGVCPNGGTQENRNDWRTFEAAQEVAEALGAGYIATDAGSHVSPRYDVIRLPQVGDAVSGSFNGDTYPAGYVASVSKTLKCITTTTGQKFYRVRQSGAWREHGTWSLVGGHHDERNPSF